MRKQLGEWCKMSTGHMKKYHSNCEVGGGTDTIFSGVTRSEMTSNQAYVSQVHPVYWLPV